MFRSLGSGLWCLLNEGNKTTDLILHEVCSRLKKKNISWVDPYIQYKWILPHCLERARITDTVFLALDVS